MTPVDAIKTCFASQPILAATPMTTSRALLMPSAPVATFAFFEITTIARAVRSAIFSRLTTTLGPAKRLWVKTPAAAQILSATTSVKSLVASFIPMLATYAPKPCGSFI